MFEPERLERPGVDMESAGQDRNWQLLMLVILTALALGGVAWLVIDRWRLLRLSTAGVATKIFHQLRRHGKRLRAPSTMEIQLMNFLRLSSSV